MNCKPILFSTPMVQALLAGRKIQTRRMIKHAPDDFLNKVNGRPKPVGSIGGVDVWSGLSGREYSCPYGKPGDLLWVRESAFDARPYLDTPMFFSGKPFYYKANMESIGCHKWKPSIHMPKAAARIFLQVKNVWVERLHDISESDIKAEGVRIPVNGIGTNRVMLRMGEKNTALDFLPEGCLHKGAPKLTQQQLMFAHFAELWCEINGRESWDANPWLWVIEFERIEKPPGFS